MLLEDLVEQEKREQGKQSMLPGSNLNTPLPPLSDAEFERLRADVSQTLMTSQGLLMLYASFPFAFFVILKRDKIAFYRTTRANANG